MSNNDILQLALGAMNLGLPTVNPDKLFLTTLAVNLANVEREGGGSR